MRAAVIAFGMAIRCAMCGRASPDRSVRCECGFEFATGSIGSAVEEAHAERGHRWRRIGGGVAAMIVGWAGAAAIPRLFAHSESDGVAIGAWLVRYVLVALGLSGLVFALFALRGGARSRRILRAAKQRGTIPEARAINKER